MTMMGGLDGLVVPGVEPQWTLGDRLRKAREHAGLQQAELADEIGIARRSLITYESDRTAPKRPVLLAWAMRTGVDSRWLETGCAYAPPPLPGEIEENDRRLAALNRPSTSANAGTTRARARTTRRYSHVAA